MMGSDVNTIAQPLVQVFEDETPYSTRECESQPLEHAAKEGWRRIRFYRASRQVALDMWG